MKILVLGSRVPWPLHDGGAIATYGMLKELAAQEADVAFFTYNTKKHFQSESVIKKAFDFCKVIAFDIDTSLSIFGAFKSFISGENYNISRFVNNNASIELEKLLNHSQFDVIIIEGLYAYPLWNGLKHKPAIPVVLRQHNVEFLIWEKLSETHKNIAKRKYLKYLSAGIKKYELKAIQSVQNILAITRADMEIFKEIHPKANHFYFPAGIHIENLGEREVENEYAFCHIGSMEWIPNQEGVKWFISEIFPGIKKKYPEAEFHIAGKGLQANDPQYAAEGVINHGEVDDAKAFQQTFHITVVPLQSGSGLRMKTIEAMALGNVVISTSVGIEGIPAQNGKEVIVANTPEDFLEAFSALFESNELRKSMVQHANEMVGKEFGLKQGIQKLLEFLNKIIRLRESEA
ncbi:MAG: glycosyltransferase [Bacteroidia bacterium]|nr:glycosyltransferase [Bacteroidia bacterium]